MTYPEAVASSDTLVLLSRTKLLVEVEDLIDTVLANLALKLFIFVQINQIFTKCKLCIHSKRFRMRMCSVISAHAKSGLITSSCKVQ